MISHNVLTQTVRYDSETGLFWWRAAGKSRNLNRPAGSLNNCGYWTLWSGGKSYLAHRLAWMYVHGAFPGGHIDHINGDRADNRIANLRLATPSQNIANSKVRKDAPAGLKGVRRYRGKWRAAITHKGRRYYLGTFDDPQDAHRVYLAAAARMFQEFARAA